MPAYSLYAQSRGEPPPEPWPTPVELTPEEEAEWEAFLAEMRADYLATHYKTAKDAREAIAGRLIGLAYKLAWDSHRKSKANDVDDLAQVMLLALSVWLVENISDENGFWWTWRQGGVSGRDGGVLRECLFKMKEGLRDYFKTLPEPEDSYSQRFWKWERSQQRQMRRRRTRHRVRRTLAALPPRDRQLLEMLRDGLTVREMAEKIGKPKSSVHDKLQQAKEKFREKFNEIPDKTQKPDS